MVLHQGEKYFQFHHEMKFVLNKLIYACTILIQRIYISTDQNYFRTMTPEREEKFKRVIAKRQTDLTVVFENVNDPHNISAVLRTCDSVGVKEVYIIQTIERPYTKLGKKSSSSASKWIEIHWFFSVKECMAEVQKKYKNIFGTKLTEQSKSLYELNLKESTALVFGNEHSGISDKLANSCTGNFLIPQVGMIESLNISVACAVSLYEAYRQRSIAGKYKTPMLTESELQKEFLKLREK